MVMSHVVDHITVDDLISNEANWHKSCHNEFGKDRLERAQKNQPTLKYNFIADGTLHQFSTLQLDSNVRSMALDLKEHFHTSNT